MRVPSANDGIHQRIADLALTLHVSQARDAADIIDHVTEHAVAAVPGAKYAGVTMVTEGRRVESAGATHPYPALLDMIQHNQQEGPCLSAVWTDHTVRIDDLATENRWPHYRRDALKSTPVKSIIFFRLFTTTDSLGALNMYADHAHAFGEESLEIGYVLATHAALALDTLRQSGQFRSALASRDLIGQAKGILMSRFDVDAIAAFELLKQISQESNVKLVEIARRVTELRNLDDATID